MTRGGARSGAGRKPGEAARLRREFLDTKQADAEAAYRLFARMMKESRSIDRRLECAREVMNRVWGKPTLPVEMDTVTPMVILDGEAPRRIEDEEP